MIAECEVCNAFIGPDGRWRDPSWGEDGMEPEPEYCRQLPDGSWEHFLSYSDSMHTAVPVVRIAPDARPGGPPSSTPTTTPEADVTSPQPTDRTLEDDQASIGYARGAVRFAQSRYELQRDILAHRMRQAIARGVQVDELAELTGFTRDEVLAMTDPLATS